MWNELLKIRQTVTMILFPKLTKNLQYFPSVLIQLTLSKWSVLLNIYPNSLLVPPYQLLLILTHLIVYLRL